MKKPLTIFSCCLFLLICSATIGIYAQEDMVFVDNSMFKNPQRMPSNFRHDIHNEKAGIVDCNVCHHVYKDGKFIEDESSEDKRCIDCHQLKNMGKKPSLMRAYHMNCKGCHAKKKAGPVMCGECHKAIQ